MCTISFFARKNGYALAMNRDEKLTRVAGLPPAKKIVNGRTVLSPSEPGGGTWIALNEAGVTFALINWHSIAAPPRINSVSRGEVVTAVCALDSPASVSAILQKLPLEKINPFRLMGIFPAILEVIQWRWDLKRIVRENQHWQAQQWVSSGFNEPTAQHVRGQIFQKALKQKSAGSLNWLRQLHCSHSPQIGPFSICMHRTDAATVSYAEVTVSQEKASLRFHPGTPCKGKRFCSVSQERPDGRPKPSVWLGSTQFPVLESAHAHPKLCGQGCSGKA